MKSFLRFFFLFVFCNLILRFHVIASHFSGGDLTYQCLGNNQYKIILNLFRDCSSFNTPGPNYPIAVKSSCDSLTLSATLLNPGGTEVSQICIQQLSQTTCNNGTYAGMQRYTYEVSATLTPCSDWVISWFDCCRNPSVNIPTSSAEGAYFEATLNSFAVSCNNSPVLTSQPIPYVCANQEVAFNWGTVEPDGDSLTYQLISARRFSSPNIIPMTYDPPFSATNPINGIAIDPLTGEITFTPNTLGNFILVIQVNEYNKAGDLLGTIMRDLQFVVNNCPNIIPPANQGHIDTASFSGTANITGPYSIELCDGGNFSFNISYSDPSASDTLTLTSNITSILPGSSFITTPGNPATATISWTAPGNFNYFNSFTVFIDDGACPVPAIQSTNYQVSVIPSTVANPDTSILCGNQVALLSASGGINFFWSVISGDPLIEGVNFSCDTCSSPIASPAVTTVYEVSSDLGTATCLNRDTIIVKIVPEFDYIKVQSDTAICIKEEVLFSINPDATSAAYTYAWSPAELFNNAAVSDPAIMFYSYGNKTVYVEITSEEGCRKNDTLQVQVSNYLMPEVLIVGDTTICVGDSSMLNALLVNAIPLSCGLSSSPCQGSAAPFTIGSANSFLTNIQYPAPYGNYFEGAKHQILFRASELLAMGFYGGQITSVAFDIASLSGTAVYKNFQIKMGCTSLSSINYWQSGLLTVFNPKTINITNGWNTHNFDTNFDWDGNSNIVVEICFNNDSGGPIPDWSANSSTYYSPTSFNSVVLLPKDDTPGLCSSPGTPTTSMNRPNIRFTTCGSVPPSTYVYSWYPGAGLSDSSIANPWVNISSDTSFTVTVTNTPGACAEAATVNLHIVPAFTFIKTQSDSMVCLNEDVQFQVEPNPSSSSYTYTWHSDATFNDSSFSNPVATFIFADSQKVVFEIANTSGCNKSDSMFVLVSPYKTPDITIVADTALCIGDTSQLLVYNTSCEYYVALYDSFGDGWTGAYLSFFANGQFVDSFSITDGYFDSVSIPVTHGNAISLGFTTGLWPGDDSFLLYDAGGNILFQDGPNPDTGIVWTGIANCDFFPAHSILWNPATWLNNNSISNPLAVPLSDTLYAVIVTDTIGGCADTAMVSIRVNTQFNYQKNQNKDSICLNESVQFTLVPDTGQNYFYSWAPATYLSNDSISDPIAGPMSVPGNYIYYFTISNGCEKTDSMFITVSPAGMPVITITGEDSICEGNNTQLIATSIGGNAPTYSFAWSPDATLNNDTIFNPTVTPLTSTTYSVIVADSIGHCSDTAVFTVDVVPYPVVQITPLTDSVCLGDNFLVLSAIPPGGMWTGTTSNDTLFPAIAGVGTHTINYSFTVPPSCTGNALLKMNVHPNPSVPVAIASNPYCSFSTVESVLATNSGGFITWYKDSLLTDTLFSGNPLLNIETGTDSFYLWVSEKSLLGCESDAYKLSIEVIPEPVATFSANPSQGLPPLNVSFSNSSQPSSNNFLWNFAGLGSSNAFDASFVFEQPGSYEVMLISTDAYGCDDTSYATVIINERDTLIIPTIFTPNNDGVNDLFKVKYSALTAFHIEIFSRWGKKVFKADEPDTGWDGKDLQGQQVHPGVYFYVITATDRNGNAIIKEDMKGTITLLRN